MAHHRQSLVDGDAMDGQMPEDMKITLGKLIAKVERLIIDVELAADARKAQYERLEAIERKQDEINTQGAAIGERLEAVETVAAEYKGIKTMGKGYLLGSAFAGGGAVLALHDYLMTFFKALKGG